MTSNEKNLYESLTSYFKYLVTITIGAISILGVFAGYFFYSNGQEMREDLKGQRLEVKEKVEEMKTALKDQKQEFETQKLLMVEELNKLSQKTNSEIDATRTTAISEISNIKGVAARLAETEARKKINELFDNKNFDQYVSDIAKERMEPQINNLVDKKILLNQNAAINELVNDLSSTDRYKSIPASTYLTNNLHIKLSEEQINKIIHDMDKVSKDARSNMIYVLVGRKSPSSTKFFAKEIEDNDNIENLEALDYFMYNDIDFNIFSDALYSNMKSKHNSKNYHSTVLRASTSNRTFTLNLLNDKRLVDLYFALVNNVNLDTEQKNLMNILKQNYPEKEISIAYFFAKK